MNEANAFEKASNRYDMDYYGIFLNTAVSATSSITASGLLGWVSSVPESQLPVIFVVFFVAQVVPKLLVETNKRYRINKAKQEGYSEAILEKGLGSETKAAAFNYFFYMCEHASYF